MDQRVSVSTRKVQRYLQSMEKQAEELRKIQLNDSYDKNLRKISTEFRNYTETGYCNFSSARMEKSPEKTEAHLVKVKYKDIENPGIMKVVYKDVKVEDFKHFQETGTSGNNGKMGKSLVNVHTGFVQGQLPLKLNVENSQDRGNSSMLSIWEEIDQLECQIRHLKIKKTGDNEKLVETSGKNGTNRFDGKTKEKSMVELGKGGKQTPKKPERKDGTFKVLQNTFTKSKSVENVGGKIEELCRESEEGKSRDTKVSGVGEQEIKTTVTSSLIENKLETNENLNSVFKNSSSSLKEDRNFANRNTKVSTVGEQEIKTTVTSSLIENKLETNENFCGIHLKENFAEKHRKNSSSSLKEDKNFADRNTKVSTVGEQKIKTTMTSSLIENKLETNENFCGIHLKENFAEKHRKNSSSSLKEDKNFADRNTKVFTVGEQKIKTTMTSSLIENKLETNENFCGIHLKENFAEKHRKNSSSSLKEDKNFADRNTIVSTVGEQEIKTTMTSSLIENKLETNENLCDTRSTKRRKNSFSSLKENRNIADETLPSAIERFLEDALGEELNNTSVTYAHLENRETVSQFNASELISEVESTDERKNLSRTTRNDETGSFGRRRMSYGSIARKLRKSLRVRRKTEETPRIERILIPTNNSDRVQKLLEELNIQETLLCQTSKAINLCYAKKDFTAGPEHVASERLLLLIDAKKKAVLEEIKNLAEEEYCDEHGEVVIKNFTLTLKNDESSNVENDFQEGEWFVVTVSHGSTVWASQPTPCFLNESKITFPGFVSVGKLTPNFKIHVKVYSLKMTKFFFDRRSSKDVVGHRNLLFSYLRRIFCQRERNIARKHCHILSSTVRNTSFVETGSLELFLRDITRSSPWKLLSVPESSVLDGNISLNIACKLHISITHAGFLTHGDEIGGYAVWNRRWCVLEGHCLKFWNYPQEQETSAPIMAINLRQCVSNEITAIDRKFCAKPKTLLIKTARAKSVQDQDSMTIECNKEFTIVRNLLSCDTVTDLMEWTLKLNHVLSILRKWKAIVTFNSYDGSYFPH